MIYQLMPTDIPIFWESIKYACKEADEVSGKDLPVYLNELLQALLSNDAQCFIRLSEERILEGILVTRILFNKQTGEKYLYAQVLYSWKFRPTETWEKEYDIVKAFGKKVGCRYIGCMSRNQRAWELFKSIGMQEQTRIFSIRLD